MNSVNDSTAEINSQIVYAFVRDNENEKLKIHLFRKKIQRYSWNGGGTILFKYLTSVIYKMSLYSQMTNNNTKVVNDFRLDKFQQSLNTYKLDVPKTSDQITPLKLLLETTDEFDITKTLHVSFKLYIAGHLIYSVPLGFLTKLCVPIKENNTIVIELPQHMQHKLHHICLPYNYITYELDTIQNISGVSMLIKHSYLHDTDRRALCASSFTDTIQINNSIRAISQTTESTTQFKLKLNFNLKTHGYFIEGDIDNLENVSLLFNNHLRWNYDKMMLKLIGNRIHKKLIYIGFNDTAYSKIQDTTVGLSGIDSIQLNITFTTPQKEVSVYDNVLNELKYGNSLCSMVYDPFDKSL